MFMADRTPSKKSEPEDAGKPIVIDAKVLFQGTREVFIDLAGVRYRLRITRRNKLILQK